MYLSLFLLLNYAKCRKIFSPGYSKSFQPPIRFQASNSLFGFSVIKSTLDNKFYVGAPMAKKNNEDFATGAVFQCHPDTLVCIEFVRINNEQKYTKENSDKRNPLFGISLIELEKNELLICALNPKSIPTREFHCQIYDLVEESMSHHGFINASSDTHYQKFTNYGIKAIYTSNEKVKTVFLSSKKYYYYNQIYESAIPQHIVETYNGVDVIAYSTFKNYIPSYTILYNPTDNDKIFLIVTYYTTNDLLGSFQVISKKDRLSHQYVDITDGSPGQYFGFSGILGKYNRDSCVDLAVSAPFYYNYIDEGRVYIFFCNPKTSKYLLKPMILQGDNLPFARFGTSLIDIGKPSPDGIQNIAVLATFWYTKDPVIYIYQSSGQKLNSEYFHKIFLESNSESPFLISYGLLSVSSGLPGKYSDILVQYPNNNTIKIVSAIEPRKLKIKVTLTVLHEMPNPTKECYTIDGSAKCYFLSKYHIESCVNFKPNVDVNKEVYDEIKLKYSLDNNPNAFIYDETFRKEVEYQSQIIHKNCFENQILFLYSSISVVPIFVTIEAVATHKIYPECKGFCSESDPVSLNYEISSPFSECISSDCGSNFKVSYNFMNKTFKKAHLSFTTVKVTIKNRGPATSYSLKIVIKCPYWMYLNSISSDMIDINLILKEIQTFEDIRSGENIQMINFLIDYVLQVSESIECYISFEVRAPLGADSTDIGILVYDPMYTYKNAEETIFEISNDGYIPLMISGFSLPSKISIERDREQNVGHTIFLEYFIEIKNDAISETINDIFMEIKVADSYKDMVFLKLLNFNYPNDFKRDECKTTNECSQSQFIIKAEYLHSQLSRKFYIIYEINSTINQMSKYKVDKVEVTSKVCFHANNKNYCQNIQIITNLNFPLKYSQITSIWPIVIAVIMSVLIIVALIIVIIKTKYLNKFKNPST